MMSVKSMVKSVVGRCVILLVVLGVIVLNPWFGLITHFSYGPDEMRAAVEGTWEVTLAPAHQTKRALTLEVRQGVEQEVHAALDLVRSANACGNRSFVRNAEACMDVSQMPLEIKLLAGDAPGDMVGLLTVFGTHFERGELKLGLGDMVINAHVSPTGEVSEISTTPDTTATLIRTKR